MNKLKRILLYGVLFYNFLHTLKNVIAIIIFSIENKNYKALKDVVTYLKFMGFYVNEFYYFRESSRVSKKINLVEYKRIVRNTFIHIIKDAGLKLNFKIDSSKEFTLYDLSILTPIIHNFLANAIKYSISNQNRGSIKVSFVDEGKNFVATVTSKYNCKEIKKYDDANNISTNNIFKILFKILNCGSLKYTQSKGCYISELKYSGVNDRELALTHKSPFKLFSSNLPD